MVDETFVRYDNFLKPALAAMFGSNVSVDRLTYYKAEILTLDRFAAVRKPLPTPCAIHDIAKWSFWAQS